MITRREALCRAAYMLGGALSASSVTALLAGCEVAGEMVDGSAAAVTRNLTEGQNETILILGEYLIPTTDTPGARTARVHEYVDAMLTNFYPAERRDRFLAGLERVDTYARHRFGAPFLKLLPPQQLELAEALHHAAFAATAPREAETSGDAGDLGSWSPEDVGPNAFMASLKELVVFGYYTSRVGATEELALNPMGSWRADIAYSEIGRAWA
jgi:hypothetical protein